MLTNLENLSYEAVLQIQVHVDFHNFAALISGVEMEYNFKEIEAKWQKFWKDNQTFKTKEDSSKEKFYALDMFPYPSGAGLHVGHPLGYIASDIYSRYKRLKGFNVLHPMGYDSFGLPAEQYAIQTGQHPSITTEENIARYRHQLDRIGFSFDWSREVRTSNPDYYKWTQWIFKLLFESWYDNDSDKAQPITSLVSTFESEGNTNVNAACEEGELFSGDDWKAYSTEQKENILLRFRLAFLAETWVNWCAALGTVLANEEVKDGVSERGGHPVERKQMMQWSLRITAYAQRLLNGLDMIDWSDALKEQQRNWIGRSEGASVHFAIHGHDETMEIFTTRPDTIFGATFMVLAPEHELVSKITLPKHQGVMAAYAEAAKNKSERDRMAEVKNISGEFTGAYALHPFNGSKIPIWVSEYVLAGYGTGAIMAVPAGDQRDWDFAKHFKLDIIPIIEGQDISESAMDLKEGKMMNSEFLDGLEVGAAIKATIAKVEELDIGRGTINFKLRDAIFSRQRYWGEPFPVYFEGETPKVLEQDKLPLKLPEVDKYLPTETGEPPLARAADWKPEQGDHYEYSTMPGWAGSSWYFLRYMDPHNENEFAAKDKLDYWGNVDLYIGGSEHATGHLLYARFWTKFLKDQGLIAIDEPFQKLINQGMILGRSNIVYRKKDSNTFVSAGLTDQHEVAPLHVDVNIVHNDILDADAFKKWRPEFADAEFILEDGKYVCGSEVEKMSKRWHNVIDPEVVCDSHGADTLRMFEMFLGPLEQYKPWDTKGIDGAHRFLKKFWKLFFHEGNSLLSDDAATEAELKVLHKTIKKIEEDLERFSFNTVVSALMICVNELLELNCNKKEILQPLVILASPYAPHIAEELWEIMGNSESVVNASFPSWDNKYLQEDSFEYPVSFNGKMRFKIELSTSLSPEEVEKEVLNSEAAQKYLEGKVPKKVIVVPKRIVNVVV